MFSKTSFHSALQTNKLNIPPPKSLICDSEPLPYVFVADDAFPLCANIMKPYKFREQLTTRRIFNYRLSRSRRVVENAFGILVSRFQVFKAPICLSPEKVEKIVLATCALHNFLGRNSRGYISSRALDVEDVNTSEIIQGAWHSAPSEGIAQWRPSSNRNPCTYAKEVRENYCAYFNGPGKVSWQDNAILK